MSCFHSVSSSSGFDTFENSHLQVQAVFYTSKFYQFCKEGISWYVRPMSWRGLKKKKTLLNKHMLVASFTWTNLQRSETKLTVHILDWGIWDILRVIVPTEQIIMVAGWDTQQWRGLEALRIALSQRCCFTLSHAPSWGKYHPQSLWAKAPCFIWG